MKKEVTNQIIDNWKTEGTTFYRGYRPDAIDDRRELSPFNLLSRVKNACTEQAAPENTGYWQEQLIKLDDIERAIMDHKEKMKIGGRTVSTRDYLLDTYCDFIVGSNDKETEELRWWLYLECSLICEHLFTCDGAYKHDCSGYWTQLKYALNKATTQKYFYNNEKIGDAVMEVCTLDNNGKPVKLTAAEAIADHVFCEDRDKWIEILDTSTQEEKDRFRESLQIYEEELYEDLKNSIIKEAKEKNVNPEKIQF